MNESDGFSTETLVCHRCGALLKPGDGNFYVVRIEAFADPSGPYVDEEESAAEIAVDIETMIERMRHMSEQELMDQVYRRMVLYLCRPCYTYWIEDPVGSETR